MTNVFCILISILKYKIHDKSISNTKYKILFPNVFQIKYKIHAKYFKYVFQIHVFQILPNTVNGSMNGKMRVQKKSEN